MKKISIILMLFLCGSLIQAQWVVQGFDSAVADTVFTHAPSSGLQTGEGAIVLTDVTDQKYDGAGAMKIDWTLHSTESWGGYAQIVYNVPQKDSTYMDWASAKSLRLWYYVLTPSDHPGSVEFRMQLYESSGNANYWSSNTDHETWYFNGGTSMYDATTGWKSITIPLVDRGKVTPNAEGFSLPGWAGTENDGILDLTKVVGYSFEVETPGGAMTTGDKATGSIIFDKLEFVETSYPPVETFDNEATGYWTLDKMEWAGGPEVQGDLVLTDKTGADAFEGLSSLQLDVKVNNSQSWGGYVNMEKTFSSPIPDISSNMNLYMFIKVLTPFSGTPGRVTMRLFLYDGPEWWEMTIPVDLYNTSGWQLIKLPLIDRGYDVGALRTDGFVVANWTAAEHKQGGGFNLSNIVGYKFEFSGDGNSAVGEICSGSLIVDLLTPGGYQETDKTPPLAPAGVTGINDVFTNLITWNDVNGESGETYNIFYSTNPIPADLPNFLQNPLPAGVEVVKSQVAEGNQLVNHILIAPETDQQVSYYYAVNAIDKAGNFGPAASSASPLTNTAKGVYTIQTTVPQNFVADGNLSEWSGIKKLHLSVEGDNPTAYIVTNSSINGDADLMVDAYIAMDDNYLYAAFEVQDDVFKPDVHANSWENDCPDLFIGLYDWHGAPHGSYKRGAAPDYHFRYAYNRILIDGLLDNLMNMGENYFYGETFTGYVVESRIPFAELATKTGDAQFLPKEGMRIPWDFEINDNDNTQREGQMDYSKDAEGNSYSTTSRWTHTWIGNKWTVGVNDKNQKDLTFRLEQNYPNPFNPTTQISYSIEKAGLVTLKIFDVLGKEIKELVNQYQGAGYYTVNFNAAGLPSGMYIYQLNSGNLMNTKKMVLIK